MKITIIETGQAPEAIRADFEDYPGMFARLISSADKGFTYETVSPLKGDALPDPATLEAILITGSKAGVYDDEPWMAPLMDFIRGAAKARTPMVGICFGHQAVANALGARVEKADAGWGLGRHEYDITAAPAWMDGFAGKTFALGVSHQDQVLSLPPGAHVIARSDFTPFAALDYGDIPAISFQGHPEFEDDYSAALYDIRLGNPLTPDQVTEAKNSLARSHNNAEVGTWIGTFFRQNEKPPAG